jgi:hypothetical protein
LSELPLLNGFVDCSLRLKSSLFWFFYRFWKCFFLCVTISILYDDNGSVFQKSRNAYRTVYFQSRETTRANRKELPYLPPIHSATLVPKLPPNIFDKFKNDFIWLIQNQLLKVLNTRNLSLPTCPSLSATVSRSHQSSQLVLQ